MKQKFDDIISEVSKFEETLQKFLDEVSPKIPIKSGNKITKIAKDWSRIIEKINEFEEYISPVEELKEKYPKGTTTEFLEVFAQYMKYMQQQHGIIMKSYMVYWRIFNIYKFANGDSAKAIEHLQYYMSGYKGIFKLGEPAAEEITEPKTYNPRV